MAYALSEELDECIQQVIIPKAYHELAEKALKETGELWPGIERTEERESFSIKTGKEKE